MIQALIAQFFVPVVLFVTKPKPLTISRTRTRILPPSNFMAETNLRVEVVIITKIASCKDSHCRLRSLPIANFAAEKYIF